jgi:DNA-binding transcriptional LysR family regulator
MTVNFDLSVLRTLVAVERNGSFARAAERVGRSESAVSLQLKRLEEQIGQKLFRRAGRAMVLTEVGERMLTYAKRLIALNDEAVGATLRPSLDGTIRLGVPPDFAATWLPTALARFARLCPEVTVETTVERSPALTARLGRGELDLAMAFAAASPPQARWSGMIPMAWIGPKGYRLHAEDPVRLAVFDPPCLFRAAAEAALDRHGISWGVEFHSQSLASLWSAVTAGLGVTVRTPEGLPPQLTTLGVAEGLPPLPATTLALFERAAPVTQAAAQLAGLLTETLTTTLGGAI